MTEDPATKRAPSRSHRPNPVDPVSAVSRLVAPTAHLSRSDTKGVGRDRVEAGTAYAKQRVENHSISSVIRRMFQMPGISKCQQRLCFSTTARMEMEERDTHRGRVRGRDFVLSLVFLIWGELIFSH